jgi:hypothetical protein
LLEPRCIGNVGLPGERGEGQAFAFSGLASPCPERKNEILTSRVAPILGGTASLGKTGGLTPNPPWRVGSGLCLFSIESRLYVLCIETAQYLLGMETSAVDSVEFL